MPNNPQSKSVVRALNSVVFDLETEPFDDNFRNARCESDRLRHIPKLRVGCTYDDRTKKYTFFEPLRAPKLIQKLFEAEQIVSFNGKKFDILVLKRHYGLGDADATTINLKHIDLCAEVERKIGERRTLDSLARFNLGEKKLANGRSMVAMGLSDLKKACQSDVRQTYMLFKKWLDESLQIPGEWGAKKNRAEDATGDLMHQHLPNPFPHQYIQMDIDSMTEGQMADYLAGLWGIMDDDDLTFVQA